MRRLALAVVVLLALLEVAGTAVSQVIDTPSRTTLPTLTLGGSTPTAITNVRVFSQTITPAQIAATAGFSEQNFTVTGLTTADKVVVNVGLAPTALCEYVGRARVSGTDTLTLTFFNSTATLCTPAAGTWTIVAIRS